MSSIRVRFLAAARTELRTAADHYDSELEGLGLDFVEEVERLTLDLVRHPYLGQPYTAGTRRAVLSRFPYSIVYRFQNQELTIVAVAHNRRKPGYWLSRL